MVRLDGVELAPQPAAVHGMAGLARQVHRPVATLGFGGRELWGGSQKIKEGWETEKRSLNISQAMGGSNLGHEKQFLVIGGFKAFFSISLFLVPG